MNKFSLPAKGGTKVIPAQGGGIVKLPGGVNRTQELWDMKSALYAKYGVI